MTTLNRPEKDIKPKRPETYAPFYFTGIDITGLCIKNGIGKSVFDAQKKSEVGSIVHSGFVPWDCKLENCGFGLSIEKISEPDDVLAIDSAYPNDIDVYQSIRLKIGNLISRNPLSLEFLDKIMKLDEI